MTELSCGDAPVIDLRLAGPTEEQWAAVCDQLSPFVWPDAKRLVVVSPHPDDETLGAGGLIGTAIERSLPVLVVSVTDGEAASRAPDLARTRRRELDRALACLDPKRSIRAQRLGIADGEVEASIESLADAIAGLIDGHDLVACPLPDDGHPDHGAVSQAATTAAARVGAAVRWFPVWAWHCHEPGLTSLAGGQRLGLTDNALARKRAASRCYASQLGGNQPVVPAGMLTRLLRPFEVFVCPS